MRAEKNIRRVIRSWWKVLGGRGQEIFVKVKGFRDSGVKGLRGVGVEGMLKLSGFKKPLEKLKGRV